MAVVFIRVYLWLFWRSQRSDDLTIFIFCESLQRFGADVSLRGQSEHRCGVGFIIRRFHHANHVVAAQGEINLLHLNAGFFEGLPACIKSLGTRADAANALLCPFEQSYVSWHMFLLFGVRRQSVAATALWILLIARGCHYSSKAPSSLRSAGALQIKS